MTVRDTSEAWLPSENDTNFLDEVQAGEETIREEFKQWVVIGEGCRMRYRTPGCA